MSWIDDQGYGRFPHLGAMSPFLRSASYMNKVRGIFGSNLILCLPMNEASGTVAKDFSAIGANGIYTSVTLAQQAPPGPSMGIAPSFDGINDNVTFSVGSLAALNAGGVFNPLEGTIMAWGFIDATHLSNATLYVIGEMGVDVNNRILVYKPSANVIRVIFIIGGVSTGNLVAYSTGSVWFNIIGTWSNSLNKIRTYINGVQSGVNSPYGGVWAGALTSSWTQIGSLSGGNFWPGSISFFTVAKVAATAAQVAQLAIPS